MAIVDEPDASTGLGEFDETENIARDPATPLARKAPDNLIGSIQRTPTVNLVNAPEAVKDRRMMDLNHPIATLS